MGRGKKIFLSMPGRVMGDGGLATVRSRSRRVVGDELRMEEAELEQNEGSEEEELVEEAIEARKRWSVAGVCWGNRQYNPASASSGFVHSAALC